MRGIVCLLGLVLGLLCSVPVHSQDCSDGSCSVAAAPTTAPALPRVVHSILSAPVRVVQMTSRAPTLQRAASVRTLAVSRVRYGARRTWGSLRLLRFNRCR